MVLLPGDDVPPRGFSLKANVIVSITKPVSGTFPITFRAKDIEGKQLLINNTASVVLIPSLKKPTQPIDLVVGKTGACAFFLMSCGNV